MPRYLCLGSVPPKRHIAHRRDGGFLGEGLYYEEVVTTRGFAGAYSILYHHRPPTRVVKVAPAGSVNPRFEDETTLRHHHLNTASVIRRGDPISGRVILMGNQEVTIGLCRPSVPQTTLYRNASADEILFIHKGQGMVRSMFGSLSFRPMDYVVIPMSTTYQIEFEDLAIAQFLVIESAGSVTIPSRYRNADGQLKLGSPYYERDLHGPTVLDFTDLEEETEIMIKDRDRLSRYTMAHHPFDVVGWDGFVYPFTFNADDFEPITGTVHQPPPVQQTFEGPGFVVCTFAPRLLDTHPQAIKVPYAHSNVQADEVLYYVRGRFGSRRGVEEGSFTLHPHGIPHGPHPGTLVASRDSVRTDDLAVMIDTQNPLRLTDEALELDDPRYPQSWMETT